MRSIFLSLLLLWLPCALIAQDEAPKPIGEEEVLNYLQEAITWQRNIADLERAPGHAREALLKDTLQQNAQKAVKNALEFARAEAKLLNAAQPTAASSTPSSDRQARIMKRLADLEQKTTSLQAALDRAASPGDKEKLSGKLKVAKVQQETLKSVMGVFTQSNTEEAADLTGKINKLSRSVANEAAEPATSSKNETVVTAVAQDKSDGIIGVSSEMLSVGHRRQDIGDLLSQTTDLRNANRELIASLRAVMQAMVKEGDAIAEQPLSLENSAQQHRQALEDWSARYKQLATTILPLGQVSMTLDTTEGNLKEWDAMLNQEWKKVFRQLIVRLFILAVTLTIPFILAEIAKRLTKRYVQDPRRQKQLRLLRHATLATLLILVLLLNFFTEFGSLATYAGFLTAGLAVALQTVLVSLIAHFFFFGRFGVRPGDRVTINGVTGDVVQVGMLRIYLMELLGEDGMLRPSGKIVAFPNSILFNPTAFSKQITGTDYAWSDLTFLLDPDSDFTLANQTIMQVVDEIYTEYKDKIHEQHEALQRYTHLSVKMPKPRSELRITENGLVCMVHYPIILKRAAETHARLTHQLIDAFRGVPSLHLELSHPIKIIVAKPDQIINSAL